MPKSIFFTILQILKPAKMPLAMFNIFSCFYIFMTYLNTMKIVLVFVVFNIKRFGMSDRGSEEEVFAFGISIEDNTRLFDTNRK